ncbi:formate dehydrogenase accessory sulfurtransferase FdhD [Ralstonia insidiosa]|jgi:FdhD protein|uniref:formate dehydrogenase accessory sulfurtransferase FdhD n=1 Tax=Ralstonia TaxID=48736 RepID=UPI0006649116|nr:formate dehydrogenase accessory sulfurtransferase FdhD [Ralstonia insidiosa]KMW44075.1 formate dehydrogenase [Ralstonia sp. MD27]MBX3771624.1 formate dehydrogenase accessory sulfurtransferase FdhD [Ralstonia pickettii]NOZ99906.1 formate dehydrogenase accessory sulfurtransferase FdhD [Betaproteobacteria bacterium]MBA9858600.1 formate dehydrogenase accessory sulfurtransferase FdhD [Ralstonia insidiosa]MBA9871742.1 formate dehydrogenase accessory sulfurtransferase FdhD [Ralstonia insidiosa]
MQPRFTSADHAGSESCAVTRYRNGAPISTADKVVEELPVALVFNGISHAVMMATPIDLEAFALGFALSEGIVECASDVFDIEAIHRPDSAEVQLTISQQAFMALKDKRRTLTGRSGCGVCGIESIALLDLHPTHIDHAGTANDIGAAAIERAARELPAHQVLMHETGGIHAAAWCSRNGEVLSVFEDVGRHNALDKLIGQLARLKIDTRTGFVFLSSRASYELVRKAARVGIPMVATISAPTSLAIDIAQQAGIRLLGFCRENGFVEYTSPITESTANLAPAMACGPSR